MRNVTSLECNRLDSPPMRSSQIVRASLVFVVTQMHVVDIDVSTPDGAKLRATYYSPGKPEPTMLLLHQCNMDRKSWSALGTALSESGVHALAIDYRGYGDSPRGNGRATLATDI